MKRLLLWEESDSKNNRCCFPVSCDWHFSGLGCGPRSLPALERKSPLELG